MSLSYKYERNTLIDIVTSSGLKLIGEHASKDKHFLTLLLKK